MSALLERARDFDLTPAQREVRRAVREFAEAEILPHVEDHERREAYPLELIARLAPLGLMGPLIPEAYGGSFADYVTYGVICEELARVDWVVASVVSVANSLVASAILRFGSATQKQEWLPRIATGEVLCSACLTEPGGGTDLASMRASATRVAGGWRLDGTKIFISHAAHAGLFLAVASVDRAARQRGVTAFLVDPRATPGVRISPFPMRTLRRDNLAEVCFEGAFVPDARVLGEPGQGFAVLGTALDAGRYSVAARCVGHSQRCLDLALPYANERRAFGQAIGEFQLIQQKLTEMACRTQQARVLVYQLGRMKDAGLERCTLEASMAKLLASRAAVQNALDGMQIFGGYSCSAEYEIGRLLLEAKTLEFIEGTSELHTKLIAESLLGLRRA